jgi:hypothetical protein
MTHISSDNDIYLNYDQFVYTKSLYPLDAVSIDLHLELNFYKNDFNKVLFWLSELYYSEFYQLLWDLLYINYFDFYAVTMPGFIKTLHSYKKQWLSNKNIKYIVIISKTLFNLKIDRRVYDIRMFSLNNNISDKLQYIYKYKNPNKIMTDTKTIYLSIKYNNLHNILYLFNDQKYFNVIKNIINNTKYFADFKTMINNDDINDSMNLLVLTSNLILWYDTKNKIDISLNHKLDNLKVYKSDINSFKLNETNINNIYSNSNIHFSQNITNFHLFDTTKNIIFNHFINISKKQFNLFISNCPFWINIIHNFRGKFDKITKKIIWSNKFNKKLFYKKIFK